MEKKIHIPVLLKESIEYLKVKEDGFYMDCTAGFGGHSDKIIEKLKTGKIYCIEQDKLAYEYLLNKYKNNNKIVLINDNYNIIGSFSDIKFDGILYDLGVSSFQLDSNERGFAFKTDALLDMRMSLDTDITAYEVVNTFSFEELLHILKTYGDETRCKSIAKAIIRFRAKKPIKTTFELADIVRKVYNIPSYIKQRIDPATKTFQAIRIYVNKELEKLTESLNAGFDLLKISGRMVVISYHSLEDRIVKKFFKSKVRNCICNLRLNNECKCGRKVEGEILTKKPETASELEIKQNRRSRSAKMRIIEKLKA